MCDATPLQYDRVLMLAAGTGIAPMAQLIQAILSNENEEGRIRLLYACRTYSDILMKGEIREWKQFWNFSAVFVLSQVLHWNVLSEQNTVDCGENISVYIQSYAIYIYTVDS